MPKKSNGQYDQPIIISDDENSFPIIDHVNSQNNLPIIISDDPIKKFKNKKNPIHIVTENFISIDSLSLLFIKGEIERFILCFTNENMKKYTMESRKTLSDFLKKYDLMFLNKSNQSEIEKNIKRLKKVLGNFRYSIQKTNTLQNKFLIEFRKKISILAIINSKKEVYYYFALDRFIIQAWKKHNADLNQSFHEEMSLFSKLAKMNSFSNQPMPDEESLINKLIDSVNIESFLSDMNSIYGRVHDEKEEGNVVLFPQEILSIAPDFPDEVSMNKFFDEASKRLAIDFFDETFEIESILLDHYKSSQSESDIVKMSQSSSSFFHKRKNPENEIIDNLHDRQRKKICHA